jgi:hypothetical protein
MRLSHDSWAAIPLDTTFPTITNGMDIEYQPRTQFFKSRIFLGPIFLIVLGWSFAILPEEQNFSISS